MLKFLQKRLMLTSSNGKNHTKVVEKYYNWNKNIHWNLPYIKYDAF